mmetsp:Transcript_10780/g.15717  ORF Transcript_10780/g.15717 Transcript_10780/m.15717 type:complete len:355 (-) Transcript_10780:677-1741(-)|eukprot:CAMPEP_0194031868 /NCGR_PEP_ID=MMETSP0009_2-20130614/4942_1 /TAXON_ID=210454 /ORGANISM="Grammatophora oceanica, Strain CCMP 410" /LENGTH=354 /DNA_ID=CAMNT_0038672131 /DNA_START=25 /DNA_END=1089 /DNA_ORIENTATION=+
MRLSDVAIVSLSLIYSVEGFTVPRRRVECHSSSSTCNLVPQKQAHAAAQEPITRLGVATVQEEATAVVPQQENENKKSYLDDGFVFGMDGSGLERPKGKSANVVVDGDSLETQPYQVAIVGITMLAHLAFAISSLESMLAVNGGNFALTGQEAVLLMVSSWILADFGSGVLHWSVDNYGNGRTPIMGSIIAAFQGHHSAPWTITYRGFFNNVYKLCVPFGIVPMAFIAFLADPFTTFFMTIFCVMEILSQEFHKWSHMTKSEVPDWVNWLQDNGITVARTPHALHHKEPFEGNYCIISGICNSWLDESGLFRRMEHLIYNLNGVESNAWKLDPELRERTLAGDYGFIHKKAIKR